MKKATLISPDIEPNERALNVQPREGAEVIVPKLHTYAALLFELTA